MPFMHPALFWGGAAAASVPVIIHLLNRRRFKVLDWAAMRFIRESIRKNRRRLRLEELLLLLLRCLAILLLAAAVGRFLGCAPPPALPLGGIRAQMTHVFILDDSVSMGQKVADTTTFKKAASDLAGMLGEIASGDRVAVLLTSRPDRSEAVFDLGRLANPEPVAERLKSLNPSDTTAKLHRVLATASEIFTDVATEKRLYVLSDFRKADFVSAGNLEALRKEMRSLRDGDVGVVLMSYGAPPGANLTVEDIRLLDKLSIASVPVRVQLRVRNNGTARAENVSVRFSTRGADGVEASPPAKTIKSIDPGTAELVQLSCVFPDRGSAVVAAELPADGLAGDNLAHLALAVRKARKLLLVDGEPELADPVNSESFYLRYALDPTQDQRYGNEAEVVPADRLAEVNFAGYEAVILANVGELPGAQIKALERYVRAGGGLVIFTGDRVNRDFYNANLYRGGTGLCPVRIGAPVGDARRRQKFVRLLRDSIANEAVMRTFQGRRAQFTQLVRFYAYTPVEQIPAAAATGTLGPVRVLARFDDHDGEPVHSPAVVARAYGDGAVMMVLASADKEWTDWPKDFTYVAFVNDMVEYVSRPAGQGFTDLVGREIDYVIGPEMAAARATLQTPAFPAEDVIALEGRQLGASRAISYQNARHAGIYQLKLELADETRTALFARNVDPVEGRLEVASQQDLGRYLQAEFEYQDRLTPAGAEAAPTGASRREYWKAALALMLMVLALEVFLGQRFGHYQ